MLEVPAIAQEGFAGCSHSRPGGRRQVLLIDVETLQEFGLAPGMVRENLTTVGLPLREIRPGQTLRVGAALLQMTLECEPCFRMDEIREGLQAELQGRRGILCRVIEGGTIHAGDSIEVLENRTVTQVASKGED